MTVYYRDMGLSALGYGAGAAAMSGLFVGAAAVLLGTGVSVASLGMIRPSGGLGVVPMISGMMGVMGMGVGALIHSEKHRSLKSEGRFIGGELDLNNATGRMEFDAKSLVTGNWERIGRIDVEKLADSPEYDPKKDPDPWWKGQGYIRQ